jgi:hypothetical protein
MSKSKKKPFDFVVVVHQEKETPGGRLEYESQIIAEGVILSTDIDHAKIALTGEVDKKYLLDPENLEIFIRPFA